MKSLHATAFLLVLSCAHLNAQTAPSLATIGETETFQLRSEAVDDTFQISVAYPFGYHETEMHYPVLYVLDAWWTFGMATDIARVLSADQLVPPMLVVGIGYSGAWTDAGALRVRDMTLRQSDELEAMIAQSMADRGAHPPITTGGANRFLRFLTDELMPRLERDYRVDQTQRILHGHSLGGSFVVDVLFRKPEAFTHYISSAPALIIDDGMSFRNEQHSAARRDSLPANLFLAVGSQDTMMGMAEGVLAMADTLRLRSYRGLEWEFVYYEDQTHRSVMPVVLRDALRHFAREPKR